MKYLPRVKLYPHQKLDREISQWLNSLPPETNKSLTIKRILYHGIQMSSTVRSTTMLDIDALRRDFLPDIRRIVDVALQERLGHIGTLPASPNPTVKEDQELISDMLDNFDLMLDEEDETW